jgi:L-ascorbate metabolism protein UlaG (beta-lactamase superfamily)
MSRDIIEKYTKNIFWYQNACIGIQGSKTVYIDPYGITEDAPTADFIFVTHPHLDNLSMETIENVIHRETTVFLTNDPGAFNDLAHVVPVKPNQSFKIEGIKVSTIPMYNTNKRFHPKEANWVGYIIELDGIRYYHAGDTDLVPEMQELEDIDVAFLPVGGVYTMDHDEAIEAAKIINPKVAIPIHFGMIVGTFDDAEEFVKNCTVPSKILKVTR